MFDRSSTCRRELLDDLSHPDVVGGVDVGEGGDVVAGAPFPRHLPQVEAVVDAVVVERHEVLLIDGVPQAQLGGDASVEEVQYGEAVGAFRGGGEAEQLPRAELLEEGPVRRRSGVVELVDDDDVEVRRVDRRRRRCREALDRCEDVLEVLRSMRPHPEFTEGRVVEYVAEGEQALFEDLCDGERRRAAGHEAESPQAPVVDRSHDGLAGAGGGDQQVPVSGRARARRRSARGSAPETAATSARSGGIAELASIVGSSRAVTELVEIEGLEVAALPVRLEDRRHLGDDVRVLGR